MEKNLLFSITFISKDTQYLAIGYLAITSNMLSYCFPCIQMLKMVILYISSLDYLLLLFNIAK